MKHIPTDQELGVMFANAWATSLALVCGKVSGNLEVVDIDCKYDLTGRLYEDYRRLVDERVPHLFNKLVVASTKSGGYHLYYRCGIVEGNRKLAQRPATEAEQAGNPDDKVRVLIETRGEGGIAVAPPSKGYNFLRGSVQQIPTITVDERKILLDCAVSLNQMKEQTRLTFSGSITRRYDENSPLDDYDRRGDVVGLLQKHGWKVVRTTGERTFMLRPGRTNSRTSGDYNHRLGLFGVFSTSTIFTPGKGYRPSAVFAYLECDGDFREAAIKLISEGYGVAHRDRKVPLQRKLVRSKGRFR